MLGVFKLLTDVCAILGFIRRMTLFGLKTSMGAVKKELESQGKM